MVIFVFVTTPSTSLFVTLPRLANIPEPIRHFTKVPNIKNDRIRYFYIGKPIDIKNLHSYFLR